MIQAALLATFDWASILERIITAVIIGVLVAGLSSWVLLKVLERTVAKLTERVDGHDRRLSDLHDQRVNCQLAAGTKYATHGEVGAMFREASGTSAEIFRKLDHLGEQFSARMDTVAAKRDREIGSLHKRATELSDRVSRIEGAQGNSGSKGDAA